jgi:hypothetical protein
MPASSGKLLQYMPCQDAPMRESRTISHQLEKGALAIHANQGHVRQIDDQLPALKVLPSASPYALYFRSPRGNQLAFHDQPSLTAVFNDRNLEHCLFLLAYRVSTKPATRRFASQLRKSLMRLADKKGVGERCRAMSKLMSTIVDVDDISHVCSSHRRALFLMRLSL